MIGRAIYVRLDNRSAWRVHAVFIRRPDSSTDRFRQFLGSLNAAVVVDVLACEGLIFVELGLYGFVEAGPKKRSLTTNYKSFVVDRQI